jgi:hypothetical protein
LFVQVPVVAITIGVSEAEVVEVSDVAEVSDPGFH